MTTDNGIVDVERNPFVKPSWVKQEYRFTKTRAKRLKPLLGLSVIEIKEKKDDKFANYPAFIGIRWGYAEVANNKLVGTKKWKNEKDDWFEEAEVKKNKKANNEPQKQQTRYSNKFNQQTVPVSDIEEIRNTLENRRKILIDRAYDRAIQMDATDRKNIIEYLEKENIPERPKTRSRLLKEFVSSAFSVNVQPYFPGKKLQQIIGTKVTGDTIDLCLNRLFDTEAFLDNGNWTPEELERLAESLRTPNHEKFETYILNTIEKISQVMQLELSSGLTPFYSKIEGETKGGPEQAWKFMMNFTKDIRHVGPGLMSDFLKNTGFPYLVKIDVHLKNEFKILLSLGKKSERSLFIYAWHLCKDLGMTPFIFDHIMYQWGRAKLQAR